jgi:O-antigen ligase
MKSFKYIILFLFFVLSFEIIAFSFGFLGWNVSLGTSFDGIQRINSTIGAATGTAMVYFLISIWCADLFFDCKKILFVIVVIAMIVTVTTMTRSGILMNIMTFVLWFSRKFFSMNIDIRRKLKILLVFILLSTFVAVVINKIGLVEAFEVRLEEAERYNVYDYDGRFSRVSQALDYIKDSIPLGVSPGHYHPRREFEISGIGYGAPHNSYILLAVEYGVFPAFMFYLSILCILIYINKNMGNSIAVNGLFAFFLVGMNTESVIVEDINWYYLLFLMISFYFWRADRMRLTFNACGGPSKESEQVAV